MPDQAMVPPNGNLEAVTCPVCAKVTWIEPGRYAATDFCQGNGETCDYPLFWVSAAGHTPPGDTPTWRHLDRLPGVRGIENDQFKECPQCAERNVLPTEQQLRDGPEPLCWTCKSPLYPKPTPPPPPPSPPQQQPTSPPLLTVPPVVPVVPRRRWWWPWPLVAVGVGVAIAVAIVVVIAVVV